MYLERIKRIVGRYKTGEITDSEFCEKAVPLIVKQMEHVDSEQDNALYEQGKLNQQIFELINKYHDAEKVSVLMANFIIEKHLESELHDFIEKQKTCLSAAGEHSSKDTITGSQCPQI